MKVVWITCVAMQDVSETLCLTKTVSGTWLDAMKEAVKNEVELYVVCILSGKNQKDENFVKDGVNYFVVFTNQMSLYGIKFKQLENKISNIIRKLNPDIVHVHGTEFATALTISNDIEKIYPVCVSIQGLVSCIAERYYKAGIRLGNCGMLVWIPMSVKRCLMKIRAKNELKIIKRFKYFLGRTDWDKAHIKSLNKECCYFKSNEVMRQEFLQEPAWNISNIQQHSIFCAGGARVPLKGFHNVIEVIHLLEHRYPNLKVYVAGNFPAKNTKRARSGYSKYIWDKIGEYNLEDKIVFTGALDASEMANLFRKSHCYIMSSSIENSSNTLCEALLVGTPTVVTLVGGVQNFVSHNSSALVVRFEEIEMMAEAVASIFDSDELAQKLSCQARKDIRDNLSNINIFDVYSRIIQEFKKE